MTIPPETSTDHRTTTTCRASISSKVITTDTTTTTTSSSTASLQNQGSFGMTPDTKNDATGSGMDDIGVQSMMEDGVEQVLSDGAMDTREKTTNGAIAKDENDNDDDDDDDDAALAGDEFYANGDSPDDAQQRKMKHWRESPFAVGLVNVTWWDDRPAWCWSTKVDQAMRDIDYNLPVSSIVCGCLGAGRVGNLAILSQSVENYEERIVDEETGQVTVNAKQRPKLIWVIGPYWTVNLFITFPLILGVSGWVCYRRVTTAHIAVIITWTFGTLLLLLSLCMISCRNPGVLYRHEQAPPDTVDWRWNDQAKTFRPPKARFDPETQVVIEGFDHTCPWTGTAIGSRNMLWFRMFVTLVLVMIFYNIVLAVPIPGF